MKPLYIAIILVVLIIIFLVFKANQNKKQAEANASLANASQNSNYSSFGQSSQVAQIISSLFPFFQTGVAAATNNQNNCPSGTIYNVQLNKCVQNTQARISSNSNKRIVWIQSNGACITDIGGTLTQIACGSVDSSKDNIVYLS